MDVKKQWHYAAQQDSESSESEAEEALCQESPYAMMAQWATEEDLGVPDQEPQRYLCDDWIQPVKVARKPRAMTAKETKSRLELLNGLMKPLPFHLHLRQCHHLHAC